MKYMRYRHGLLSLFLLLSFFSAGLAFYDDFQIYNGVTNPYFTSNYTINNSLYNSIPSGNAGGWYINSSSNVYLHYYDTNYGYTGSWYESSLINLNYTKISANANFNLGFYLLGGSQQYLGGNPILSIVYFANNTDSSKLDISTLRGYVVNIGIEGFNNISVELRRCTDSLYNPSTCGVQLDYKYFEVNNETLYYNSGYTFNNSMPINLTYNPATGLMSVILNNTVVLTYTDTVYTSGGFMFIATHKTGSGSVTPTILNIDNLSISGVTISTTAITDPAAWTITAFPQNIPNFYGASYDKITTPELAAATGGNLLTGTPYGIGFYYPTKQFYSSVYPIKKTLQFWNVLEYNNDYWTNTLQAANPRLQFVTNVYANQANTCYIRYSNGQMYLQPFSAFPSGSDISYIKESLFSNYAVPITDRSQTPRLYGSMYINCNAAQNLTFYNYVYYNGTLAFNKSVILPIGYPFSYDPNTNTLLINYSLVIDALANDTTPYEQPLTQIKESAASSQAATEDTIGRLALALVDPSMVMLYLVIFLGACVTYFTKNGIFGGITLLTLMLVMTSIGLITSWFIWLLIVISAIAIGGYILKTVGGK